MDIFLSVDNLLSECRETGLPLWELVLVRSAEDSGMSREHTWRRMEKRLTAMQEADRSYDPSQRSRSGLVGGDGEKMRLYAQSGRSIAGEFIGDMLSSALRMGECNACMHRSSEPPRREEG